MPDLERIASSNLIYMGKVHSAVDLFEMEHIHEILQSVMLDDHSQMKGFTFQTIAGHYLSDMLAPDHDTTADW